MTATTSKPKPGRLIVQSSVGVPLHLDIAPVGDRIVAVGLDYAIIVFGAVAMVLLAVFGGFSLDSAIVRACIILFLFLLRNFYFTWFELRWRGQTPGKRRRRLRVIDVEGRELTREALVVRNLTREVEVFMPLMVLSSGPQLWPGLPGWIQLLPLAWILVFANMPFFNRQRQRVGDMIAGTVVIVSPQPALLEDMSEAAPGAIEFTRQQLSVYGVYELQTLEGVLRKYDEGEYDLAERVADTIARKIEWTGPAADPQVFLRSFYAALRGHLEHELLLGRRRVDKYDTSR